MDTDPFLQRILSILSSSELKLGEIEVSNTNFLVDASVIDSQISYEIDDSLKKPKLTITSVKGEVDNIDDIARVSNDKSSITFSDYTTSLSSGYKLNYYNNFKFISSLAVIGFLSVLLFSNNRNFGGKGNLIFFFSITIYIFIGVSNSVNLSELSIRIEIKSPSTFKFNSLQLKLGSGSSNIIGLLSKSLVINSCSDIKDHQVTLSQLSIESNLNICSTKNITIKSLQLLSSNVSIALNTKSNVNLKFYNGYNGLININSKNLNIEGGGCEIKNNGLISNGTCGTGVKTTRLEVIANDGVLLSNVQVLCKVDSTWRPNPSPSNSPTSPPISNSQAQVEYKYDQSNLVFMAQSGYSSNSITDSPFGISNSFTVNYVANAPVSNWLVSKTPTPSLEANTNYQFSFSFKLGEPLNKNNVFGNMSLYLYNPTHVKDPNGTSQNFKSSPYEPLFFKTFTGDFTSSSDFITTTISVTPSVDIGISVLAFQMNRTTKSASTPSMVFFKDMKFIIPSKTITKPSKLITKDSELINIPKPPISLDPIDHSTCPYLSGDLVHWHDPTIWENKVIPLPSSIITIPNGKKVLISPCSISQTEIYKKIIIPPTSELVFADSDLTMNIQDIYVQGKFIMGSKTCRYNANINLIFHGSKTLNNTISDFYGSKGIAVDAHGFISVQGKQYHYTWTRLASTAWSGDRVIYIMDNVNWEVGQQVLITTSIFQDDLDNQNEVLTIAAIQGKQIEFTEPIKFYHYGGQEYQAEVALLSRRIVFRGDGDSEADKNSFGAHILVVGEGQFAGIQLIRMGQTNLKARYPIHYHLAGTVKNSFISDCSVTNSYYRCYTIHGTNNVTLTNNVAFDVRGHCYYLEDGVEMDNTLSFNLAAYIHVIGSGARGNNQKGQDFVESDSLRQPADSAASGFYITCPWNSLIGNSASGGWAGFSFPNLPKPIGNHRNVPIVPSQYPLKQFEGNTAHSSGSIFTANGASIYVGGNLVFNEVDGLLYYSSGRYARSTYFNGTEADGNEEWMRFNNTKIYLSNRGVSHWGERVECVYLESYDSLRPASLFGQAWLSNAIINGRSGNIVGQGFDLLYTRQGFQFYDTNVQTILSNIIFRNYIHFQGAEDPEEDNCIFIGMTHSDMYKEQGMSAIINVTIEGTDSSQFIGHRIIDTGSSRYFNFIDYDGSIFSTPKGTPKVIGSHEQWWNYDSTCKYHSEWLVWVCDRSTHEISTLYILIPGLIDSDNLMDQVIPVGNMSLFGGGVTDFRGTVVTRNPGVTGISSSSNCVSAGGSCGVGWYFYLTGGSPTYMKIWVGQVVYGQHIFLAIPYPQFTTFNISCDLKGTKLYNKNYTLGSSAADVRSGDGSKYYFDGTHLFIKVVNFANKGGNNESFNRGGAKIYNQLKYYFLHITANNIVTPPTKLINGYFTGLPYSLPSSTL
ncbi:hypothetical protein ACTFIV_009171 [Dictyostelium citrinum]